MACGISLCIRSTRERWSRAFDSGRAGNILPRDYNAIFKQLSRNTARRKLKMTHTVWRQDFSRRRQESLRRSIHWQKLQMELRQDLRCRIKLSQKGQVESELVFSHGYLWEETIHGGMPPKWFGVWFAGK